MGNQSEHGQSIYWKPQSIELPAYLNSDKILDTPRKEAGRPCSALEIAESATSRVSGQFKALAEMHSNRDPRITPAAHMEKVAQAAERTGRDARKVLGGALETLGKKKAQILSELDSRLGIAPNASPHAQEIRSVIRSMSEKDRSAFIMDALNKGDNVTVSAILEAHPVTIGLEQKHIDGYKQRYYHLHAKDDLRHVKALDTAAERIAQQIDDTVEISAQLEALPPELAQQAQRADEAAAKANF